MRCAGVWISVSALCVTACVSRPPTIAHVHVGHALTAVPSTPNHVGYLAQAESRAREAIDMAQRAGASGDLPQMKKYVASAAEATDSPDGFGVKQALALAADHVSFAATSADASTNLHQSAPVFVSHTARVLERCSLIRLLADDVAASTSVPEAQISIAEIRKLAQANLTGDVDASGAVGSSSAQYGLAQIRSELESITSRENPPYVTVDRWYLLNLVRLPSGKWIFDRLRRTDSMEGYK